CRTDYGAAGCRDRCAAPRAAWARRVVAARLGAFPVQRLVVLGFPQFAVRDCGLSLRLRGLDRHPRCQTRSAHPRVFGGCDRTVLSSPVWVRTLRPVGGCLRSGNSPGRAAAPVAQPRGIARQLPAIYPRPRAVARQPAACRIADDRLRRAAIQAVRAGGARDIPRPLLSSRRRDLADCRAIRILYLAARDAAADTRNAY